MSGTALPCHMYVSTTRAQHMDQVHSQPGLQPVCALHAERLWWHLQSAASCVHCSLRCPVTSARPMWTACFAATSLATSHGCRTLPRDQRRRPFWVDVSDQVIDRVVHKVGHLQIEAHLSRAAWRCAAQSPQPAATERELLGTLLCGSRTTGWPQAALPGGTVTGSNWALPPEAGSL